VDEITGQKTLDSSSIAKDIHAQSCEYVGNYAIRIHWSDGHDTGLYNFKLLREKG
jgi:ATP-binding protein involved in chromosome partitioning